MLAICPPLQIVNIVVSCAINAEQAIGLLYFHKSHRAIVQGWRVSKDQVGKKNYPEGVISTASGALVVGGVRDIYVYVKGFPRIHMDSGHRHFAKTLPEAQRTQKLTPRLGLNLATTWRHLH